MFFCGCAQPEAAAETLRKVLALHPLHEPGRSEELKRLIPDTGARLFILYVIDHKEWTEHGGIVEYGWLTPLGEEMLAALEEEAKVEYEGLFAEHCIHGNDTGAPDGCAECEKELRG